MRGPAGRAAGATAGRDALGLEAERVTWAQQRRFASEWFPDAELVPTAGLVEDLRRVKDAGEVARIEAAAAAADHALAVGPAAARRAARGARGRPRARRRDAPGGRVRAVVRDDRRVRPQRRQAPRPAVGAPDRARASWS